MPETLVSASVKTHAGFNNENLFRAQVGTVWFGDLAASLITTLIDTTAVGKVKIPDTYESVGYLSEDGLEHEEDMGAFEQRGWGSLTILRRDIENWDHTFTFSMIENKRIAYDVATGQDTKAKQMSAAGEWTNVRPSRPATMYRRCLALAQDYEGDELVIMGKFWPRVSLTEKGSETWANQDDVLMREVTMGADDDSTLGGPMSDFLLGPGALARAAAMGIEVATV